MKAEPGVDFSDLLAAREDLAVMEKTSSAFVRKNTQSSINKVVIGRVGRICNYALRLIIKWFIQYLINFRFVNENWIQSYNYNDIE